MATELLISPHKEAALAQPMTDNFSLAGELQSTHRAIHRICDSLESIADSLPANVDRRICHSLSQELVPAIKAAQEFEEMKIFPAVRKAAGGRESVLETVSRLEYEHFEDLCFAEEVADVLRRLSNGAAVNIEAVGYMLRGLFGALRRHIVFEEGYLETMTHY
ncbi:hemerythrin domain-containing protein [Martelella mediterranea]|uniref:Hemerythrin HHE cation binding domain-containing protein n=1 Tax=Martelella mediterranea TaxID=293089 RepID=A0A4R3NYX5_9HYPH|nr:hemerythrin domain-containing protein [Martelella mediterranea]TCT40310.1 hemerythrin HHE cation binding domain-containing protein [Martelella mediterranea]